MKNPSLKKIYFGFGLLAAFALAAFSGIFALAFRLGQIPPASDPANSFPLQQALVQSLELVAVTGAFLVIATLAGLLFYQHLRLFRPLETLENRLLRLAKGELRAVPTDDSPTGPLGPAIRITGRLANNLRLLSDFAENAAENEDEAEFRLAGEADIPGKALIDLVKVYRLQKNGASEREKELNSKCRLLKAELNKSNRETESLLQEKEDKLRDAYLQIIEAGKELKDNAEEVLAVNRDLGLAKEELEDKNTELLELNKEKNHLIGIVAHDLRNPLSSSLCVAELLEEEQDNLNEEQIEYVSVIRNALGRMNEMINRILDIKMIEAGDTQIDYKVFDFVEVCQEVCQSLKDGAERKHIKIECDFQSVQVRADRGYCFQIVENLISNALKFSPLYRSVSIQLKTNDGKAEFSVRDEGPGISKDEMGLLFKKYTTLSARPTGGEKSTGLGLSIVKKYTELMGGQVRCESEIGQGAAFIIEMKEYTD